MIPDKLVHVCLVLADGEGGAIDQNCQRYANLPNDGRKRGETDEFFTIA